MTTATERIVHEYFCLPRPGTKEIRTETYTLDTDSGPVGIARCLECGAQHITRTGQQ